MVVPHQTAHKIPRGDVQVETREPDKVLQLGKTKVRIFAPQVSPEEVDRREDALYEVMAEILRSLPSEQHGA